jgi:branched-chain amino acid transport system ATP-binding protein
VHASHGSIYLDGEDVTRYKPHQLVKRGISHVPEGRGIFPSLTVRENLRAFAPRGNEDEALDKAATAFPLLGERANGVAGTLSGGQQQMLALVRAWIRNPRLVLVDEPSLGLAPLVVDVVYEFLESVPSSESGLIVVEQYVDKVLKIADEVHVLMHGEIVYSGLAANADREEISRHYLGSV